MNLTWKLAFRNLMRQRRRSVSTAIAIVIGFAGLTLLGSFILRAHYARKAQTVYINLQGHLQIHKKDGFSKFSISPAKYYIDPDLNEKLMQILNQFNDEIEYTSPFLSGSGLLINGEQTQPFLALGYDRKIFKKSLNQISVQTWAKDWIRSGAEEVPEVDLFDDSKISVTPKIARILSGSKGKELLPIHTQLQLMTKTFFGDLNGADAEIGMFHTTGIEFADDNSIQASIKLMQNLFGIDGYQYQGVFVRDGANEKKLQKKIEDQIKQKSLPLEVFHFTADGIGDTYNGVMGFFYVVGSLYFLLILGIVILSISNALTMGIIERSKELGTLKSLGFTQNQIVELFVKEAIWLSAISIIIGFLLSQIIARAINFANIRYNPPGVEGSMQFFLAPSLLLYLVLAAALLVVAILTAYLVSKRKVNLTSTQLLSGL